MHEDSQRDIINNPYSKVLIYNNFYIGSTPGAAPYKTKPPQKCGGFVVSGVWFFFHSAVYALAVLTWLFTTRRTHCLHITGENKSVPFSIVQPRCIFLPNFAICEIAGRRKRRPARLVCRGSCTTSGFAQKNDANPVGGRGISAFSLVFSFAMIFFTRRQHTVT